MQNRWTEHPARPPEDHIRLPIAAQVAYSPLMRILATLAALILIAAPVTAQRRPDPAEAYSIRLQRLDELQRYATLRRVVSSSGLACRRVALARPAGRYRNLVIWNVRCAPRGDYALFIGPDSSVQARLCAETARLKLPPCRLPPILR